MSATAAEATFLFTDVEGSTRLWEAHPAAMADALVRHDRLCRAAVESRGGLVVKMTGDGLHAVFADAAVAVAAALDLQRGMAAIEHACGFAFRMRCGLHAGTAQSRDDDYFGVAVNRAARIMSAAHGGQVLLSQAVADAGNGRLPEGAGLLHLGRVRLRDLAGAEDLWQLTHADLARTFPPLRSLDATPNNLPQQATSFVGREQAMAEVEALLERARLVTLTGAGGCGKTRLALQVVAGLLERFEDGVWLVDLAPLARPAMVAQAVAEVLGVREEPERPLQRTLTAHLAGRNALVLLDNAEHLVATCAELADALLRECPHLVLVATSREALGVAGEVTYRVPSLTMPDLAVGTPEAIVSSEAGRLFVERAQAHAPRFAVTAANAPAVASICLRLDGIPLALELAAARLRALTVDEVNRRLDQRFRLLTGGARTALPRQQTLRALIDWSYDLLSGDEQALLRRVSVFAGGWTLAAVEDVCAGDGVDAANVLDLSASLADKSLVVADEHGGAMRYRLLETVRQYARDRLLEHGDGARWRDRHLAHFVAFAEACEPELLGAGQRGALDRADAEHDNLRTALEWAAAGDVPAGLRLAGALFQFWWVRGHHDEARAWYEALLTVADGGADPALCAKAQNCAGVLAMARGDYAGSRALFERSLATRRSLDDRPGVARVLTNLGVAALEQGDYAAAQALNEEALATRRALGDRWATASSLTNLGHVAREQGDLATARARYEECLALHRALGDPRGIATSLLCFGNVAFDQEDYATARARFAESVALFREIADRQSMAAALINLATAASRMGELAEARALFEECVALVQQLGDRRCLAFALEGLADVALARSAPARAARIWGAAQRLREDIGVPLPPTERPHLERQVVAARTALGDDRAFEAAWMEGRSLAPDEVAAHAVAPDLG